MDQTAFNFDSIPPSDEAAVLALLREGRRAAVPWSNLATTVAQSGRAAEISVALAWILSASAAVPARGDVQSSLKPVGAEVRN